MGHSLGSVVAYDSLNALLNEDEANEHRLGVAQRTRLFLTFGSPLDKTAYIFSQHERPFAATRGLMAMAVQPLICSYRRFRRIPWINVHSRRDPVCDALRLYDDPAAEECAEHCVRNVVDPEARVPLAAHVEYWDNACIYDQLWSGLVASAPGGSAETTGLRSRPDEQPARHETPRSAADPAGERP